MQQLVEYRMAMNRVVFRRSYFKYDLRKTTLFIAILCCLSWLLTDFEFQYYNINLNS